MLDSLLILMGGFHAEALGLKFWGASGRIKDLQSFHGV